ncbi:MAG: 50S ribosomal protein L4 [bacterium]|nr:50S ribosomal protein L4 [bacterium]
MAVNTYTKSGTKATTAARLRKDVFEVEVTNHDLLKQAYVAHQANSRVNLAKTLKRGEVRGGGKKPWKQKGTGRARFGSSRVPIWRGGGIVWGPTGNENYSKKIHTSAKQAAVRQALSVSNKEGKLSVIETLDLKDGKTASAFNLMNKIGVKGTTLIVVSTKTPELIRAFRNLTGIKLATATYLNVFDILNADSIVMTSDAVNAVHDWLKKAEA